MIQARSNVYLPMAAIVLTAALAVSAAAQNQVPFKGAMQGHDSDTPGPSPNLPDRMSRRLHPVSLASRKFTPLLRFAGAQGNFTVERLANVATFLTSGSFHGTIPFPGAVP